MTTNLTLTPACLERLKAILLNRAGVLVFDHQERHLSDYIANVLAHNHYHGCPDYLDYIEKASERSVEFEDLIAEVTVGESYFFRDTKQMEFLQRQWIPHILQDKREHRDPLLHIWSAGCSNGQEIYSVAILLKEYLSQEFERWRLNLLGTDINPYALRLAIAANYSPWSLRATPHAIKRKYFKEVEDGKHYTLIPEIRQSVNFSYHNLIHDEKPAMLTPFYGVDLILCRNVFIYFAPDMIEKVMHFFYKCLLPGGILLLGSSDFFSGAISGFNFIQTDGISYYQKEAYDSVLVSDSAFSLKELVQAETKSNHIQLSLETEKKFDEESGRDLLLEIEEKMRIADWQSALFLIKQLEWSKKQTDQRKLIRYKIRALSNLGYAQEGLEVCDQAIKSDKLNAELFLWKALLLMDLHDFEQAETAFKSVLFLDRNFAEAYYYLGTLYLRRGDEAIGLKYLHLALDYAQKQAEKNMLKIMPGVTFAQFVDMLKNEIRIYVHEK